MHFHCLLHRTEFILAVYFNLVLFSCGATKNPLFFIFFAASFYLLLCLSHPKRKGYEMKFQWLHCKRSNFTGNIDWQGFVVNVHKVATRSEEHNMFLGQNQIDTYMKLRLS